jgi:hypothetical protein
VIIQPSGDIKIVIEDFAEEFQDDLLPRRLTVTYVTVAGFCSKLSQIPPPTFQKSQQTAPHGKACSCI